MRSIIDLSGTEFVIDASYTSITNGKHLQASTEWPHWHNVTITATQDTGHGSAAPCVIRSLNDPNSAGASNDRQELLAIAAMNQWNGNYFIPIVRLLRLGESSRTISTSRSLINKHDNDHVNGNDIKIRQTKYNGVVIATSTHDDTTIMIIPSLSLYWSHNTHPIANLYGDANVNGNNNHLNGVPIGSAFNGIYDNSMSESIVDLLYTKWQVDIIHTKWSFIHEGTVGSNRGNGSNRCNGTGFVDITNPSRVRITANGCGSMSPSHVNGFIIITLSPTAVIPNAHVSTCNAVVSISMVFLYAVN